MDETNRPVGRKKRVGSGSDDVRKRGEGLGGRTEGPVGESGGYADRREDSGADSARRTGGGLAGPSTGGASSGGGGAPSGGMGGLPMGGGCLKFVLIGIVIVAAIAIVVWLMGGLSGGGEDTSSDTVGGGLTGSTTTVATVPQLDAGAGAVSTAVSPQARDKFTKLKGGGADTATIMVYMCGTDLEAKAGMATSDLQEMLYAEISDRVNIIVETGGTSKWQNNVISSSTNQRYRVTTEGLESLDKNLGRRSMVDPATLTDFITYCEKNYPADRYLLVMWDHGGGSLTGYGYDQVFPGDSMTLDEVAVALKNGGCTFDVVGFDACLMGALETAVVLEPYADYMIASEEVEPGIGWYYTGWITALSQNTSIATTDLGKKLIDDYVTDCRSKTPQSQATLSLVDLAELKGTVPPAFVAFSTSINGLIDAEDYQTVSDARAGAKEFASSSQINQVDLIHFAQKLGTAEAQKLTEVLRSCIKYNRTSTNITNANGLSVFFPYGKLSQMGAMLDTYQEIGIPAEYSDCLRSYASVAAGGQVVSTGSGSVLDSLLGGMTGGQGQSSGGPSGAETVAALLEAFLSRGDFSRITGEAGGAPAWLDVDRMKASQAYYEQNRFDVSALVITEKGGQRVLALPDEQWDLVHHMELNVFLDDGEGFIDLGLDNVYEYNDAGDLLLEYDGTWLALNGRIVSYYLMSDDRAGDTYSTKGRVPALLNDQLVDIILVFDNDDPYGRVLGAQPRYDAAAETETVAKGLIDIVAGDTIDYLCDYYTYEGDYDDTYFLGEPYTATGEWEIENLSVGGAAGYQMTYRLTDIYGNRYWTPPVSD